MPSSPHYPPCLFIAVHGLLSGYPRQYRATDHSILLHSKPVGLWTSVLSRRHIGFAFYPLLLKVVLAVLYVSCLLVV